MAPTLKLYTTNVSDGETIHQRCLLVKGRCEISQNGDAPISIRTTCPTTNDLEYPENNPETFPEQYWPTAGGHFKALVMLSPGPNRLTITHQHGTGTESQMSITVTYIPLIQFPPLHLAIMAAKDSPLLIDCPPYKGGGISSAHADLDAAIAKFRMTAYMWQAMTAEDMRMKGFGRRSFRLDEEWTADTVSREFLDATHNESLQLGGAMRATAKVTIVRSERSTKEIRDANVAQQNPRARNQDGLFDYFKDALKSHGGPFTSSAHPIVAGLILDSQFSVSQSMIFGHAALGCHDPRGISLGIFGSHLTYSWPRFIEEVTHCLTDTKHPGDKVGNDNGECLSMWEACTIGQGAFIHEVGHAFGSPHRPGIMERGYAHDWPKNFVAKTAYCKCKKEEGVLVTDSTPNNACWHLKDALSFKALPHFRLPSDAQLPQHIRDAAPQATAIFPDDDEDTETASTLKLHCPAGIVQVSFNGTPESHPSITRPLPEMLLPVASLSTRFPPSDAAPVSLSILALNGKEHKIPNLWKFLAKRATQYIRIPNSSLRINKQTTCSPEQEEAPKDDDEVYSWAQLLRAKGEDGGLYPATSIDLRVGCLWDGGVVYYADGGRSHWGPMRRQGYDHHFGGHASEEISIPEGVTIVKVEVNRGGYRHEMSGVRVHLSNGSVAGELNDRDEGSDIVVLEPREGEVIVGFCGKSERESFCGVVEFGILTVGKDTGLDGLPVQVFEMEELRNTAGLEDDAGSDGSDGSEGSERSGKKRKRAH